MKAKSDNTFWIKGLIWFLVISFLFTILSRAADSFTIAKVTVCSPSSRKIQHTLTAEGRIEKNREISVITQADILVKTILVNEGQQVAKGDVLAVLDTDHLEECIAEIRDERQALELQNQTARSNQKQERKKQQQTLQRAKADYEWLQKQNRKEIKQAKTELKKLEKALQKTKTSMQSKKTKTPDSSQAVNNAEQTDSIAKMPDSSQADNNVEQADSIVSLQESIANQKTQIAELQKTARTEEQTAKRALEDAKISPVDDHTIEINNISILKLNKQIEGLITLQKQKGEILAPADGVITAILVNTGQKTSDTGMFTMTDEEAGLKFVSQISSKDADLVSVGNMITLKNTMQETEVPITSLELDESQESMILTALLPAGTFSLGNTVSAYVMQESENYHYTVPLSAIYDDNGKKYVLSLEKKDTVLGEQEVARKIEVQVVEHNDLYAALESETIQEDSQIITDTDRLVKAGDRIRLKEK